MTRRMLINAQSKEELRIAVVDGPTLEELQVEVAERGLTRGNIYRGRIANIQPSLNAAFIDYGAERHGFLALQDLVPEAYYHSPKGKERPRIEDVLDRGKPIVVQVTKEPEGQKGAALTTNLSLAGRYLVVTPFDPSIGVSRKVGDDETRKALKQLVKKLEVPDGCGAIVRTNAHGQNKTTLNRDLNALLRLWKRIGTEARKGKEIKLLYSDQDIILQCLRDYLDSTIEEVVVDDEAAHSKAEQYMRAFMPRSKTQLVRYDERTPIFSKYHLETQIDRIYQRSVELPSGGSIVIDRAEALTAIDINSGRSTKAKSQEETALNTNLESALEVARQLRLRDIGGLIVVDFIDMRTMKNRRKVEKTLRDAMKPDKARFEVGRISSNGLLEINRQRIKQALLMRTHHACPTCGGTGRLASPELVGLNLIRRIEARAASGAIKHVCITLHAEVADAVQNQRRRELSAIENEFAISIEIVSSSRFHPSEQKIDWTSRPAEERSEVPPEPIRKETSVATLTDSSEEMNSHIDEEDSEETTPRRRRRRRGGRRRRRSGGEGEVAPEGSELDPANDEAEAVPADTNAQDEGEESPPRRRRGRRGGRGRNRDRSESPSEEAGTSDNLAEESSKASTDTEETKEPQPPRRPRRGRRSRRQTVESNETSLGDGDSTESSVDNGTESLTALQPSESSEVSENSEDKPSRARRGRSRRGRTAKGSDASEQPVALTPESDGMTDRPEEKATASEPADSSTVVEPPTPTRARRGRTRRPAPAPIPETETSSEAASKSKALPSVFFETTPEPPADADKPDASADQMVDALLAESLVEEKPKKRRSPRASRAKRVVDAVKALVQSEAPSPTPEPESLRDSSDPVSPDQGDSKDEG